MTESECRVQSFGKADLVSGDDLQVRAVLGRAPLVANNGPEGANLAFVSAPLVTLETGDAAHFEVYDRDVFAVSVIEKVQAAWNGGRLAKRTSKATVECRQLSGAPLQRLVSIRAARADANTSKLGSADLDGRSYDWGFPEDELKAARRDVGDVAGLVGWDDARVRRRVTATEAAVANVNAKKPAIFDSLHAGAKASATVARDGHRRRDEPKLIASDRLRMMVSSSW